MNRFKTRNLSKLFDILNELKEINADFQDELGTMRVCDDVIQAVKDLQENIRALQPEDFE